MLLTENEITIQLKDLDSWQLSNNELVKDYLFKNFVDAMSFVTKVGLIAEKLNHHPNIFIHSWNKVKISVSTHSENGITEKDFDLIKKLENKN